MKRTQIQLDEQTYERLRKTAYERKTSVAGVIREAVGEYLAGGKETEPKRKLTLADFPWIGMVHEELPLPDPDSTEWGDVAYWEHKEKAEEFRRIHGDGQS